MKILYVVGNPAYRIEADTGYGAHIRGILDAFRKQGHDVLAVVGKERGPAGHAGDSPRSARPFTRLFKRFVPAFLLRDPRQLYLILYNYRLYRRLCGIVEDFKPDVIYERAEYLSNAGIRAGKRYGVPVFLEANATIDLELKNFFGRSLLFPLGRRLERSVYSNCRWVFAVSRPVKEDIMDSYGIDPRRITVVQNGVDPDKYKPKRARRELRSEIGFSDDEIVVGFVGSLLPWHGVDKLVESADECLRVAPNLRFLVVGGEESRIGIRTREDLDNQVRELGIEDKVFFTGVVSNTEVPNYIQLMDICVYPGSDEHPNPYGSPIKLFEYGIMGKPIVSFHSSVIAETLRDGVDGILIASGSVPELTKAILKLAADVPLRDRMGKKFRDKVLANYTWENIGGTIVDVMSRNI